MRGRVILILSCLLSAVDFLRADETQEIVWLEWQDPDSEISWQYRTVDDGVAIRQSEYAVIKGDVQIPTSVAGCPVTEIAEHAIWQNRDMVTLSIPTSVVRMAENAICECRGLTCVYFMGDMPSGNKAFSDNPASPTFYIPHDAIENPGLLGGGVCRKYLKDVDRLPIEDWWESVRYSGNWRRTDDVDGAACYFCKGSRDSITHHYFYLGIYDHRVGYVKFKYKSERSDALGADPRWGVVFLEDEDAGAVEVERKTIDGWTECTVRLTGSSTEVGFVTSLPQGNDTVRLYVKDVEWISAGKDIREKTKWFCTINDESAAYLAVLYEREYYRSDYDPYEVCLAYELSEFSPARGLIYPNVYAPELMQEAPSSGMEMLYADGSDCYGYYLDFELSLTFDDVATSRPNLIRYSYYSPPTHSHYTIELDPGEHGSFDGWTGDPYRSGSYCWRLEPGDFLSAESLMHIDPGYRIAGWELVNYDWYEIGYSSFSWCTVGYGTLYYRAQYAPIVNTVTYVNTFGLENPNPPEYSLELELLPLRGMRKGFRFAGWDVKHGPEREVQNDYRVYVDQWYNEDLVCSYYWTDGDLVATAMWEPAIAFGDAVGDARRGWIKDGDADWFTVWSEDKEAWCVRSGEICDGQTSTLETVVTNGGTVSFEVKVSCEGIQRGKRTDGLTILVDGAEKLWLDGEVGWTNVTIAVAGEGEHRIKWKYSKDVECAAGDDCAYLANFKFYHQVVVSFDGGGATVGEVPSDIVSYNGGTITLPEVGTMKKINHSFAGWSDGVEVYQPGAIFVLGDVPPTFTAVWSRKELESPVIEVPARYETERTRVTITAVEGATIRYTIDGTDPIENGLVYQGPFEVAGSLTIRAVAVRDDWYDSAVVEASTVRAPWGYAECLNCEDVGFTSGGDSAWVRDLLVSHDGMASVRSGKIGNSETNWLEATVIGAGTLSFWWKASAEMWRQQFVDCGTVWIDGVEQAGVKIGDHDDWRQELIAVKGGARHTIRWVYSKDVEDAVPFVWEDCIWLDEVKWTPVLPSVVDDADATVAGDAETGFVVKPSEGKTAVEVTIPQGVDAAKVTVEVSVKVTSVKPNGANVKVVNVGADITEFLNVPAADGNGVVDLTKATVKEEIVKEAMDVEKGAKIELVASNPSLTTPNTRKGLFYQFREGETLAGMKNGDSKVGDGQPWSPEIKVKGGNSAFYSIGVGKGE